MTIQPGAEAHGHFLPYTVDGLPTVWWWQVDDDDAVYSGTAPTQAEAWRQAHAAVDRASPMMVARAEGVTAGLDAMRARAEAAETRAALAEFAVDAWRELMLSRVRERLGDPDLTTDYPGTQRDQEHRLWRVVSPRGVAGVGRTEAEALLRALDGARASG